ncbi:hypothetical protein Rcae01_02166 [Novipirellula caenicola]|uniref:Uncharacterized protein n=1 Tax=Novipirellula caenicola TaxID=1536901 RepID=A0ABP9VNE2_9BACT
MRVLFAGGANACSDGEAGGRIEKVKLTIANLKMVEGDDSMRLRKKSLNRRKGRQRR